MDIDDFKTINDTYGHNVGDQSLREVAQTLQAALRPYDLCVRYAGDEFIVVLTDSTRESADLKLRELQERIAGIELEVRGGVKIRLGASAGAVAAPGALVSEAQADSENKDERRKARYQPDSADVKAFYRVNNYPK